MPTCLALAVDPSDPDRPGLRHACFLASASGAELVVLVIGSTRTGEGQDEDAAAELLAAARRMASVPVRVRVPPALPAGAERAHGPPARSRTGDCGARPPGVERRILAPAGRAGARLLVMPRGERWSGALYLLLSVAERVIDGASFPVLVVPDRDDRARLTVAAQPRILMLEPGDGPSSVECFLWAAGLARPLEGAVLTASPGPEAREGDGLPSLVARHGADLVVVPRDGPDRGGPGARSLSGLASAAVRTAPCPVLVVPRSRQAAGSALAGRGPLPTARRRTLRTGTVEARPTDGRARET